MEELQFSFVPIRNQSLSTIEYAMALLEELFSDHSEDKEEIENIEVETPPGESIPLEQPISPRVVTSREHIVFIGDEGDLSEESQEQPTAN